MSIKKQIYIPPEDRKMGVTPENVIKENDRRAKKGMQEIAKSLLSLAYQNGGEADPAKLQSFAEAQGANLSVGAVMLTAQIGKAISEGDTKAFMAVMSVAGEDKHSEMKVDLSVNSTKKLDSIVGQLGGNICDTSRDEFFDGEEEEEEDDGGKD